MAQVIISLAGKEIKNISQSDGTSCHFIGWMEIKNISQSDGTSQPCVHTMKWPMAIKNWQTGSLYLSEAQ